MEHILDFHLDSALWYILIFGFGILGFTVYQKLRFKYGQECRNCGKPTEIKRAMMCNNCFNKNKELFPKDWSNKK